MNDGFNYINVEFGKRNTEIVISSLMFVYQVGLKLKGTHQLLVYADDMNLLRDNIDTIKKNTETLTDASKEVGLQADAEKLIICCCLVTRMQGKIVT
jgi:hypothetical protein